MQALEKKYHTITSAMARAERVAAAAEKAGAKVGCAGQPGWVRQHSPPSASFHEWVLVSTNKVALIALQAWTKRKRGRRSGRSPSSTFLSMLANGAQCARRLFLQGADKEKEKERAEPPRRSGRTAQQVGTAGVAMGIAQGCVCWLGLARPPKSRQPGVTQTSALQTSHLAPIAGGVFRPRQGQQERWWPSHGFFTALP